MAATPISVFGLLEMHYSAYGKPHVARFYVDEFGTDPAVGTFTASGTPASLDDLATAITGVVKPLYQSDSGLSWGDWIGKKHVGSGISFVPINNGTITPAVASFGATVGEQPGAPEQNTWTFRDSNNGLVKFEQIGAVYQTSGVLRYGGIGGAFKTFADYILGSIRIRSRSDHSIAAMVSVTFDTNDGLTRRYRR